MFGQSPMTADHWTISSGKIKKLGSFFLVVALVVQMLLPLVTFAAIVETTLPQLVSASVNRDKLRLNYSEALATTSVPTAGDFEVTVNSETTPRSISAVAIPAGQWAVVLTLAQRVSSTDSVYVVYTPGANRIKDIAGNAALAGRTYAHNGTDMSTPQRVSATVNRDKLELEYDEELAAAPLPAASDFAVKVYDAVIGQYVGRAVSSVSISGSTVILTLSRRVSGGESVIVAYTPGTNPIRDLDGNKANADNGTFAHNGTDMSTPRRVSATVNRDKLELEYDEALAATPLPAASDFAVQVYDPATGQQVARTVSGVAISGSTVILTLNPRVSGGEYVSVDYTPGANPIRDLDGNKADASSTNVHNGTDVSTPQFVSATVNRDKLELEYDEALAATPLPAASDFAVKVYDPATYEYVARAVSGVAISGSTVILTLNPRVSGGEYVSVDYTPGANPIRDLDNNKASVVNARVHNGTDVSTPRRVSATVNRDKLELEYDEAIATTPLPTASDFAVTVYDYTTGEFVGRAVSGVSISGSTVTLTLSRRVTSSDSVSVEYTPGTNPLRDLDGNMANTDSTSVHNGTDLSTPQFVSATVNGNKLRLSYDEQISGSPVPAAGNFAVTVYDSATGVSVARSISGVSIPAGDWSVLLTLAAPVGAGDSVLVEYTVGSNPIRDLDGNSAAAIIASAFNAADYSVPQLTTAAVNRDKLAMNYSHNLDASSVPAVSDFAVKVYDPATGDYVARAVSAVAVSGSTVILTLNPRVSGGEYVSVEYTPGTNPIQDTAGNPAETGSASAHNGTDISTPQFVRATVNRDQLKLVYIELP